MVNQTIASGGTMEQDKFYYSEYFKKISNGQKMLLDQCLAESVSYTHLFILRMQVSIPFIVPVPPMLTVKTNL